MLFQAMCLCLLHCCPLKTFYTTLFLLVPFPSSTVVPVNQGCSPPRAVFGTVGGKQRSEVNSVPVAAVPEDTVNELTPRLVGLLLSEEQDVRSGSPYLLSCAVLGWL